MNRFSCQRSLTCAGPLSTFRGQFQIGFDPLFSSEGFVMARQLRVQVPGAIYHVVTRGDGLRQIFHDNGHYDRLTRGLKEEVTRSGWKVLSYCWMPNHIHLLVQTPEPNLARGMQHRLPGYANWYSKRNQGVGHLFQGRWTGETIASLSQAFGLAHPDSASNLVRRAKLRIDKSREYRQAINDIEFNLGLKTENLTPAKRSLSNLAVNPEYSKKLTKLRLNAVEEFRKKDGDFVDHLPAQKEL